MVTKERAKNKKKQEYCQCRAIETSIARKQYYQKTRDSTLENVRNKFKTNEERNKTREHIRMVTELASDADFENSNSRATRDKEKTRYLTDENYRKRKADRIMNRCWIDKSYQEKVK